MLFRWSIWGDKRDRFEMLRHSIGTFRSCFGPFAEYVVFTDEPQDVRSMLNGIAKTLAFNEHAEPCFDITSKATWRKWCPAVRLSTSETEIYVDSDVFIVGEPGELRQFCTGLPGNRFLAMQESVGERWCFGRLESKVPNNTPFINAGLIGQQPDADLTHNLLAQYEWWMENVPPDQATFHDEQGAVVAALAPYVENGLVDLMSPLRYRIVSPRSNPELKTLDDVALIHATHPDHPAFDWFLSQIQKYEKIGSTLDPSRNHFD